MNKAIIRNLGKKHSKNILCILVLIIIVFLWQTLFDVESVEESDVTSEYINVSNFTSSHVEVDKVQKCWIYMYSRHRKSVNVMRWLEIFEVTKICTKDIIKFIPIMDNTPGTPEHKFYMMPRTPFINDTCSVVTFGIGGDVDSELHVKMMLPQCRFLGFDPNLAYKPLYEQKLGGTYVRAGVESKKGGSNTIRQVDGGHWHSVQGVNLNSAAKLIKTYHGEDKMIDILNVDIEGFEYSVFEDMLKEKIFDRVCQVNFEIHPVWMHNTGYTIDDVFEMFIGIAKKGTFLWVETTSFHNITYCLYFVNVRNPQCVEKYLKNRLL